ncbi:MAG: metallophosphoesterase, partial [Shewanella sp.]
MNNNFIKGSLALTVLTALTGCNSSANGVITPCTENVCKLTILHTNDTHGRFWHNAENEYGMAAQKTLVDRLRAEAKAAGSEVLLLSGGDVNTGVPESDLQDAEPDFMAMNSIRYDAMAVGNHEFDNPLSVLETQREWAKFPMLSANIYDKASGKHYFDPYKVFTLESGLKVAVLGLTTEDTAQLVDPDNVKTLEFRDPTSEAAKLGQQLRSNKEADLVFAITHMGHYENGQHGSNAPGDVEMARALPAGTLDAII